jgi:hypothetical protein
MTKQLRKLCLLIFATAISTIGISANANTVFKDNAHSFGLVILNASTLPLDFKLTTNKNSCAKWDNRDFSLSAHSSKTVYGNILSCLSHPFVFTVTFNITSELLSKKTQQTSFMVTCAYADSGCGSNATGFPLILPNGKKLHFLDTGNSNPFTYILYTKDK